ncbi:hypothetical protein M8J75_004268 [Diaphorina citri]|nr:hypothetical protein M8J75_004268 [Diaphorina citri]
MSSQASKFALPPRFEASVYSVWVEFIQLSLDHKPLNLGQGFPDYESAPSHVSKGLADAATGENKLLNQYTRGFGHPRIVQAIAKLYSSLIERPLNPMSEVLVTVGAYEALFCAINGFLHPGDEVIIIEPFFDCYAPMTEAAGGVPVYIPLRDTSPAEPGQHKSSADFKLDPAELESKFSSRTKLIILNTPHNPLGKVFTREELEVFTKEELEVIAKLCKKYDVLCISDEVYEWQVYKPHQHIRICTLPGMFERTITIGSAGKTFSMTGWKLGWAYGPANLMRNLQIVHQNCIYTSSTPTQEAVARSFETEINNMTTAPDKCYFYTISEELRPKREILADALDKAGMVPVIPDGGYFMVADWTQLRPMLRLDTESDKYEDFKFAKWMTKNVKLQGIPPSAFYSDEHKHLGENLIRYCFFKKDETLREASSILQTWRNKNKL